MKFKIDKTADDLLPPMLPPNRQPHITLENQQEINQLYGLLSSIPVIKILGNTGCWSELREFLQPIAFDKPYWQKLLTEAIIKRK